MGSEPLSWLTLEVPVPQTVAVAHCARKDVTSMPLPDGKGAARIGDGWFAVADVNLMAPDTLAYPPAGDWRDAAGSREKGPRRRHCGRHTRSPQPRRQALTKSCSTSPGRHRSMSSGHCASLPRRWHEHPQEQVIRCRCRGRRARSRSRPSYGTWNGTLIDSASVAPDAFCETVRALGRRGTQHRGGHHPLLTRTTAVDARQANKPRGHPMRRHQECP